MARHVLKPTEPLEIEFADGTKKIALFNNSAFLIYADKFGDISEGMREEVTENPYGFGSKLLYAGLKVTNPLITLEEATSILLMGGEELLFEIIRLLIDNFMISTNEETKKKFQIEMEKEFKAIEKILSS